MLREKSVQEVTLRRLLAEDKKEAARDLVMRMVEENTTFVFSGFSRNMISAGPLTSQTAVRIILSDRRVIDVEIRTFMTEAECNAVWTKIAEKFVQLPDHALFRLDLPDTTLQQIVSGMHYLWSWLDGAGRMNDLGDKVMVKHILSGFYFERNPLATIFGLSAKDYGRPTSTRHRLYNVFVDCLLSHKAGMKEIRERVLTCLEYGLGVFRTEQVFRLAGMKCFGVGDEGLAAVLQKYFLRLWHEITQPSTTDGSNAALLPFGFLARKGMVHSNPDPWFRSPLDPLCQLLAEMMSKGATRIVFEIAYLIGTDMGLFELTRHDDAVMGEQPHHREELAQKLVRSLVPEAFRLARQRKEYGNAAALVYEFTHEYCIPADERPLDQQTQGDEAHTSDLLKVNRVCELAFLQGQRIPINNCRWNYNPV